MEKNKTKQNDTENGHSDQALTLLERISIKVAIKNKLIWWSLKEHIF